MMFDPFRLYRSFSPLTVHAAGGATPMQAKWITVDLDRIYGG